MPLWRTLPNPPALLTFSPFGINLESVEAGVSVETMTNFVSASGVELKDIYTLRSQLARSSIGGRESRPSPLTNPTSWRGW